VRTLPTTKLAALVATLAVALLLACAPSGAAPAAQGGTQPTPIGTPQESSPARVPSDLVTPQPAQLKQIVYAIPSTNANFLPIYAAEKLGYFAQDGLTVSIMPMRTDLGLAGLTTGEVAYVGSTNSAIGAAVKGLPVRLASIIVNRGSFYLFTKPTIQTFADLKGKTIGEASLAGQQDYLLRLMLRANGLDPANDVQLLGLGEESAGLPAVLSGAIDAAIAGPPTPLVAERQGLRILGNTADYAEVPLATVAARADRLQDNRAEVRAVIRAVLRGTQYILAQPNEAAQFLVEWMQIPPDQAADTIRLQTSAYSRNGSLSEEAMLVAIETQKREAQITTDIPVSQVFDFSLLREVQAELGLPQ
jgi:NitT/TauT family transport system substrate-binding protein